MQVANAFPRPQNPSCPAGGADNRENAERGVQVAPPSGNTSSLEPYQVLHTGFDTLTIAVKAILPPDVAEYFETQRTIAEHESREILIEWNGVELHLQGHGGKGYRFVANSGAFGARWAFKKPNAKDPWGVTVTFGSVFMATRDLGGAQAHLDRVLDRLGMRVKPEDFSISRFDICSDFYAPNFTLIPENFVMHSSTNRQDFIEKSVNGKSGRVTSVRVGGVKSRSAIIYDKRLEVTQKLKPYWWHIWNTNLTQKGLPNLAPKDPRSKVWRVELRAGKLLLKDRWNIRTWEDLYARFGDLVAHSMSSIRYTDPAPTDINRARWPNHLLWELAGSEFANDLRYMREFSDPDGVKFVHKAQHISTLTKNARGTLVSLAAINGTSFDQLDTFFDTTLREFKNDLESEAEHLCKLHQAASDRYRFIS